jgi:hypothetical protein
MASTVSTRLTFAHMRKMIVTIITLHAIILDPVYTIVHATLDGTETDTLAMTLTSALAALVRMVQLVQNLLANHQLSSMHQMVEPSVSPALVTTRDHRRIHTDVTVLQALQTACVLLDGIQSPMHTLHNTSKRVLSTWEATVISISTSAYHLRARTLLDAASRATVIPSRSMRTHVHAMKGLQTVCAITTSLWNTQTNATFPKATPTVAS